MQFNLYPYLLSCQSLDSAYLPGLLRIPSDNCVVPVGGFCRRTDSTFSSLWKGIPGLSITSVVAAPERGTLRAPKLVLATHSPLGSHELAVKFGNPVPHFLLPLHHHRVLLSGAVGKSHIPVPIPGGLIGKFLQALGPKNLGIFSLRLGCLAIAVSGRGWMVSFPSS